MQSTTSQNQRASNLARTVMGSILSKLVNQHTKRIILMTSLYARVSRMEKLQQSAMAKLNQLMVLATNENSLSFSARFHSVIWRDTNLAGILTPEVLQSHMNEEQRRELSTQVVDMSPMCLRYGSKCQMIKDVQTLLFQGMSLTSSVAHTTS
jgi:hypothetical protein